MTNEEEREKEISLISKIICVIVTWAKLNGYNPNDVIKKISGWLGAIDSIASFENFSPSWSCVIRALDDEALAEFIIDNIKENIENYDDNEFGITSPLGGYIEMQCSDAAELTEILKREVDL